MQHESGRTIPAALEALDRSGLIGRSESEATQVVEDAGGFVRRVELGWPITLDLNPYRVRITVERGVVTSAF